MANIIKQFKDSDGNNVYPLAYAQGGMKMDLLWTNPTPTSNFAAQTISLDLSNYDLVYIVFKFTTSYDYYGSSMSLINGLLYLCSISQYNSGDAVKRQYTPNDSGISFTGARGATSSTSSDNNAYCIPYKIYGIKMSYIVPTQVHGLQYIEV